MSDNGLSELGSRGPALLEILFERSRLVDSRQVGRLPAEIAQRLSHGPNATFRDNESVVEDSFRVHANLDREASSTEGFGLRAKAWCRCSGLAQHLDLRASSDQGE